MRNKSIWAAACAVFIAAAAAATTWELYASYPTPGPDPRGYTSEGDFRGYIVQDGPTPYVYFMYWYTWRIMASFPAPGGPGAWGICRGTGSLRCPFAGPGDMDRMYEITTSGSVARSLRCPFAGRADTNRLGCWIVIPIPERNVIAVVEENTGSLVSTFKAPGSRPTACGGYLGEFFVADSATHTVYQEGKPVITGIKTPTGFGNIATMVKDYVVEVQVVDDATDYIYFYRSLSKVEPASLGRVKALFE